MAKADVAAGRAYVSIYAKTNELTKALNKAKQELQDFGGGFMKIGGSIAAAGSAIVGGFGGALAYFTQVGSDLNDLSARTGISTTALAELGYAAELTGTSMDSVESGVKKMQKNLGGIGPESKKAVESLEAMGLTLDELSGLAPEDQFQMIAESIGSIDDPSRKAAAAMAIFGGSGTDLIPLMENIGELRDEARDLGIAPSPESVQAADMLGDAIDRVRKVVGSALFEIGGAVAPMATEIADGMLVAVKAVRNFIKENKPLIVTAAKVGAIIAAVGGAIFAVGVAFVGTGLAIGAVLSAFAGIAAAGSAVASIAGAIGAAIASLVSPVGLAVVALVAGTVAFFRFTEVGRTAIATLVGSVTELFGKLKKTTSDTFGGIVEAIRAGDLSLAGQIAMVGLQLVFQQGLEAINNLFGESLGKITGQLLSGDFAGAWATTGSVVLDSWAQVTQGMVSMMTMATNKIADLWADTVNKITNQILQLASEGGFFGDLFESISGVDMQAETARAAKLEAERRNLGLKPQTDGVDQQIANGTYKDPGVEAIKNRIKAITAEIDSGMASVTAATGQAVTDAAGNQSEQTSANIRNLQEELARLRAEAAAKIEAGKKEALGGPKSEEAKKAAAGQAGSVSSSSGPSSVATNNLLALQSAISSPQAKQVKLQEEQNKKSDKQIMLLENLLASNEKLGLYHA